jgi:hypothetical protein
MCCIRWRTRGFGNDEQYRQLGITRFSELSVRGFLNGGSYEAIPLDVNAYTLGGRFEQESLTFRSSTQIVQPSHIAAGCPNSLREDSEVLPAMGAITVVGNSKAAAELLGNREFSRMRTRLRQLGTCFLKDEPVPRQRRPYKRRVTTRINLRIR